MLIKLAIIGAVLVVGGIIFGSEIQEIFPNTTSTGVDSIKSDVNTLATNSIQTAEEKIESSVEQAETKLTDFGHKTIQTAEEKIESSVEQAENTFSGIKQNSNDYIEEQISNNLPFQDSDD